MTWNVVPLCNAQLEDVNPDDILEGGLYRKCNTYKGGGGYDKFPEIYNKRMGTQRTDLNNQFVVQLQGCPLRCPYCYVTADGILGPAQKVTTQQMVASYRASGCSVFHLMGGAPALYLADWSELLQELHGEVFHSDFLCLEGEYDSAILQEIAGYSNSLYAVSVKGSTPDEFHRNTATSYNEELFERNLHALKDAGVPFYFTFTGMSPASVQHFKDEHSDYNFSDSFAIELVHYKALDYKGD